MWSTVRQPNKCYGLMQDLTSFEVNKSNLLKRVILDKSGCVTASVYYHTYSVFKIDCWKSVVNLE